VADRFIGCAFREEGSPVLGTSLRMVAGQWLMVVVRPGASGARKESWESRGAVASWLVVPEWAFMLCSAVVLVAGWRVVATPDVGRASAALAVVLGAMAPLFVMLAAEFVAVVQVLVYLGATIVLFLFALMLTRRGREDADQSSRWRLPAIAVSGAVLLLFVGGSRGAQGPPQV
jgi:hypothetical protein